MRQVVAFIIVAAGYFLSARIGLTLVPAGGHMAVFWPPVGVAVAAFILLPVRRWGPVGAGVFAANLIANFMSGHTGNVSFAYAVTNVLEPLLVAAALRRCCGGLDLSTQLRTVQFFTVVAVCTVITATSGAAIPMLAYGDTFWEHYLRWLVADSVGVIVLAPLIVYWRDAGRLFFGTQAPRRRAEFVVLMIAIAAVSFTHVLIQSVAVTFAVLNLTVLMRVAFSFGAPGVAVGIALQSGMMVFGFISGGDFMYTGSRYLEGTLIEIQLFAVAAASASYVAAAAFGEQRRLNKVEREQSALLRDSVAELQRSKSELLAQTTRLDAVFERAPFIMAIVDPAARVLRINHAAGAVGPGAGKDEHLGRLTGQVLGCINASDGPGCGCTLACKTCPIRSRLLRVIQTGESVQDEQGRITLLREGAPVAVDFLISVSPIGLERGSDFLMTLVDITERVHTEELLKSNEARLREAQQIGMMGNWELDVTDGGLWWSDEVYQLFGIPNRGGISFEKFIDLVHPDDRESVRSAISASVEHGMTSWQFDYRILRDRDKVRFMRESATADVDAHGRVVRRRGIVQDVTEMKIIEEQLRQAQKMEAVGTLAGGLAHDFNNILNVVKGYCFLIARGAAPDNPLLGHVREVLAATERGVALTNSLLTFSRRRETGSAVIGLNTVVRGVQGMIVSLLGDDVRLETSLAQEDPQVQGDAGQLGQVLMNFATNAHDAMPRGGKLEISTGTLEKPASLPRLGQSTEPGQYAVLRVRDTGKGMPEQVRQRVFEPFYTTKDTGRGTGLGLAVVYGIVKQHRGFVDCDSAPGTGTTFTVYLPLATDVHNAAVSAVALEKVFPGGHEHLLIAEDDEPGRLMLSLVLKEYGYEVTTARDGREALELFNADPGRFALLILDLVMPKRTGLDVLDAARRLRPGVPVILMSGYSDEVIREKGMTIASIPILRKPIEIGALCVRIREVIDAAQRR